MVWGLTTCLRSITNNKVLSSEIQIPHSADEIYCVCVLCTVQRPCSFSVFFTSHESNQYTWLWKKSPTLCTHKQGPQRPPELVLLTGQIRHLTAFNCDLLTSCWLVFLSQWPIAISLVIALLKSSRELDNARELYMSPVSSVSKNRMSPLNEISACLQWGAPVGSRGEKWEFVCFRVCACQYLQETVSVNAKALVCLCVDIMWSEGVWRVICNTSPLVHSDMFLCPWERERVSFSCSKTNSSMWTTHTRLGVK